MTKKKKPTVVIFGRTNVGKSTLFNCLIEKKQALVSDTAGTTRDSNLSEVSWRRLDFNLVDTAGVIEEKLIRKYLKQAEFDVEKQVQEQAKSYLEKSDLIVFVVDSKDGLLPEDRKLARQLKKEFKQPIILVANKADNPRIRKETHEFNKLGLGEPLPVSAASGSGTGDLLDRIFDVFGAQSDETQENKKEDLRITILGKPNVGKSSLINKLCGESLQIVSHLPHTTREPKDIVIGWKDYNLLFIDTAGMNRKGFKNVKSPRERESLERLSINRSLSTLRDADVALLVLDITEEIGQQEAKIMEAIVKNKCSLIIVANKWDAIEDRDTKKYTEMIRSHFPYATWAPIQFLSALSGEKLSRLKDLILEVNQQRRIELNDNALNKFLKQILKHHRPVKSKGTKQPYVHKFYQTRTCPPKFSLKIGSRDTVHESYVRFVENQLRKKFGFIGAPITIYIEKNRAVHGQHEQFLKEKINEDNTGEN